MERWEEKINDAVVGAYSAIMRRHGFDKAPEVMRNLDKAISGLTPTFEAINNDDEALRFILTLGDFFTILGKGFEQAKQAKDLQDGQKK